jgi:TolA-binding protein
MKRAQRKLSLVLLWTVSCTIALASCRTSQQARRSQSSARPAVAGSVGTDSLLMIEQRLVDVIDSLTSVVDRDHSRIQSLEQEVMSLRARFEGRAPMGGQSYGTPPPSNGQGYQQNPPPSSYTPPSYTPPSYTPPSYTPPRTSVMGPVPQNPASPAGQGSSGSYQGSVQERYASALRLYNENNFLAALSALQQLEVDDPNGPLTSNYHYWAGESLYALKRYSEAIQEFTNVSTNYPSSL